MEGVLYITKHRMHQHRPGLERIVRALAMKPSETFGRYGSRLQSTSTIHPTVSSFLWAKCVYVLEGNCLQSFSYAAFRNFGRQLY